MRRAATLALAFVLCGGLSGAGQFTRPGTPLSGSAPVNPADPTNHASDIPAIDPAAERAQQKRRLQQAYERMRRDTDSLGDLAAKLDAELDPANGANSHADALNDARRIEKLAAEFDRLMRQN
jgi:hypothetical protein